MSTISIISPNPTSAKIHTKQLDLILARPPAPFRDEKEEEGLTSFDLIYKYLPNVRKWFQLQSSNSSQTIDENQFLMHFRKLTSFKDHEILDLFDTFDKDDSGKTGFDEFFLLISLLAARECCRTTQFLHLHGEALFSVLSKGSPQISFERFARIGFVVGVPEHMILQRLKEFGVGVFDTMNCEEFNLYYFTILDDLDKGNFDAKSANVLTSINTNDETVKSNEKCSIS